MLTIRKAVAEDAPQLKARWLCSYQHRFAHPGAMPMNWRYFLSKNMPKMLYVGV